MILKEIGKVLKRVDKEKTDRLLEEIILAKKINLVGDGRSGYVGEMFAMRLKHLGLKLGKGDLSIVISGSGETGSILKQVKKMKEVICITMNPKSSVAKKADLVIEIKAGKSRQPMRSLFEQSTLIYLDNLILLLMKKLKISEKEMWKRHK